MDFAFSESQLSWYEAAVKFATEQLSDPHSIEREQNGEFWREGYLRCARFGVQGLPVPTEFGGRGQDLLSTVAAMEGLGYGCCDTGLVFAIGASLWTTTMAILAFGTDCPEAAVSAWALRRQPARGQRRKRARSRIRYLFDANPRGTAPRRLDA